MLSSIDCFFQLSLNSFLVSLYDNQGDRKDKRKTKVVNNKEEILGLTGITEESVTELLQRQLQITFQSRNGKKIVLQCPVLYWSLSFNRLSLYLHFHCHLSPYVP